ncbi:hypothetical protein [Chryseobacterium daeguense]|uniref:hypothetical protein n=1 Tax=Chryseobacterium daeguense TaxID=412438 RepID=UPI0004006989|nr:hypothetical protein [Chryseobacterium daeguense]
MKNFLCLLSFVSALALPVSCKKESKPDPTPEAKHEAMSVAKAVQDHVESVHRKPADFLPKGFVLFKEIQGDLNNDGLKDCILIIKATEKDKIITDENRGKLDRNRRGIVILFKTKNDDYELIVENKACFSSENEDGGVYFAPELDVSIDKNKLFVHYAHGRYGYWAYTFKYINSDFQLIGYDSSDNSGPVVNRETSINFLTGKKQEKVNTNTDAEGGDEVFMENWSKIPVHKPILLSEIKDFDELEAS